MSEDKASNTDAANDNTRPAETESRETRKPRQVYLSSYAEFIVKNPDGSTKTENVKRSIVSFLEYIKSAEIPEDSMIAIFAVEDPELSDPLSEGQERYRKPLLPPSDDNESGYMKTGDAIRFLISSLVPEGKAIQEFQRLCDFMSYYSPLSASLLTFMFKGGRVGGFNFVSGTVDIDESELSKFADSASLHVAKLKESLRETHPSIRFDSDSRIILPFQK